MNSDKRHCPIEPVCSQKSIWNETKKEEDDELDFASKTFADEPWLWCGPCRFGICEEH